MCRVCRPFKKFVEVGEIHLDMSNRGVNLRIGSAVRAMGTTSRPTNIGTGCPGDEDELEAAAVTSRVGRGASGRFSGSSIRVDRCEREISHLHSNIFWRIVMR